MDEFEALLREFRPRRPGPLPKPLKARPMLWLLSVAAAALALVVRNVPLRRGFEGGSHAKHPAQTSEVATLGALTPLALRDPAALDAVLDRMSQTLLPDVQQPDHALSALGRNSK